MNTNPDQSAGDNSPRAQAIIQNGNTVAIVCTAICAIAACFSIFAFYHATLAEREARMAEYYITELDATLIEKGIREPGETFQKFRQVNSKE